MKDREDRIFLLFTDLLHHTNHYAGGNMEQNRIMVTVPEETDYSAGIAPVRNRVPHRASAL